jgi:hypothetical protein
MLIQNVDFFAWLLLHQKIRRADNLALRTSTMVDANLDTLKCTEINHRKSNYH